jgi:putative transcriptional regulator
MSETTTKVRIDTNGNMLRETAKGWERVERVPLSPTPDDFIAAYDPDNIPRTPEQLAKAIRVPRCRTLRRQLSMTQQEFADQYQIPIGTLRDWEQYRSEPDATAKAYLKVIAADPGLVAAMLKPKVMAAE